MRGRGCSRCDAKHHCRYFYSYTVYFKSYSTRHGTGARYTHYSTVRESIYLLADTHTHTHQIPSGRDHFYSTTVYTSRARQQIKLPSIVKPFFCMFTLLPSHHCARNIVCTFKKAKFPHRRRRRRPACTRLHNLKILLKASYCYPAIISSHRILSCKV